MVNSFIGHGDASVVAFLVAAVLLFRVPQLAAASFELERWFRTISPALVGVTFAGIGAPLVTLSATSGLWATTVGLGFVAILMGWVRLRPRRLAVIPGCSRRGLRRAAHRWRPPFCTWSHGSQ